MDTALLNGEFDLDSRGMPYIITGLAELMQRVAVCLKMKRASFIYSRTLGSELNSVKEVEDAVHSRAELLAREAVAEVPQTSLGELKVTKTANGKIKITLEIRLRDENGVVEVII
ncbi:MULTISPECIES: hypothetical protein [unclassified Ruminococcus]|uniref:hypothetical protein n=1 Tax=unclassified Ruminococcus TaxID=2608920 RepID=UPI00210C9242|nr:MULTISPECIES: hypothetical protein [unclassified Ruminococcus]MCQ4021534.1 hypothetical protein [Ruminococcus sp. zg-924]MCQ4113979.1 hypothetical protein [Ruminococcus sp. zg-921]